MTQISPPLVLEVLKKATKPLTSREIGIALDLPAYTASQSVQYPITALLHKGYIKRIRTAWLNTYIINND